MMQIFLSCQLLQVKTNKRYAGSSNWTVKVYNLIVSFPVICHPEICDVIVVIEQVIEHCLTERWI